MEFTVVQSGTRRRLQAAANAVPAGVTTHVVATFDGAAQRLYLNGAQAVTRAQTGSATTTTNELTIGAWDPWQEFLRGTVDEVAVYKTVLSATRIKAHYDMGRPTAARAAAAMVAAPVVRARSGPAAVAARAVRVSAAASRTVRRAPVPRGRVTVNRIGSRVGPVRTARARDPKAVVRMFRGRTVRLLCPLDARRGA
jgi:hypothetical protein